MTDALGDPASAEPVLELVYKAGGRPYMDVLERVASANQKDLRRAVGDEMALAFTLLNDIHEVASHYMTSIVRFAPRKRNHPTALLISCFHKSLINLGCSLLLSERGFYGPARPLLRQAFEAVVIGKFCAVAKSPNVHDKWFDGGDVYLTPHVFKKIKSPHPEPLQRFWRELSTLTHATIYATQVKLAFRDEEGLEQLWLNLVFLAVIAECLYHLLSTHLVTDSARYFQRLYGDKDEARRSASKFKNDLSRLKREFATKEAAKVGMSYRADWVTA